jgi:tRNA G10  N-methylase Trm11
MKSKGNIADLKHGRIDAVLTSPPYGETTAKGLSEKQIRICEKTQKRKYTDKSWRTAKQYSENPNNIGNLSFGKTGTYAVEGKSSTNNIGNLKKETYLEAMLKVYTEMFKVLKPGGKAIVVVKPFIRDRKSVDLPLHSWLLLEKVGFKLVKVYKFRLPTTSFWRVLQSRRCDYAKGTQGDKCSLHNVCSYKATKTCASCPDYINTLERLNHEYVLVVEKPNPCEPISSP